MISVAKTNVYLRFSTFSLSPLLGVHLVHLSVILLEKYASVEQVEGETIIVIVDPFMRRVHKYVPQSGDLLLMDATSNLDRSDTKLFHLMTPAAVGALPLGTIITSREDEKTILKGLQMMKKILPTYAFYGRGPNLGPVLGLTDDSDAERNALRIAWPLIQLLLCFFHVLQAHWQFIFKSESKIEKKDKPALLRMMRKRKDNEQTNMWNLLRTCR